MPDGQQDRETVGLIGVGLLGTALAERMLAGRWDVLGFDIDPARGEHLAKIGGRAADDLQEIPRCCRRLVLCLPDSHVVRQVVDEIEPALPAGAVLINTTTGQPEMSQQLAQRLASRNVDFLEATIAGSSQLTREGRAVVMVGGEEEVLDRQRDLLSSISTNLFHLGPVGAASRAKLVVNLVLGLNRAALAEGLALAESAGLDQQTMLAVLRAGPANSAALESKGEKMVRRQYAPLARLAQHAKDVRLILEMARRSDCSLPLSNIHLQLLQRAIELGHGDQDNSAVREAFRGLSALQEGELSDHRPDQKEQADH